MYQRINLLNLGLTMKSKATRRFLIAMVSMLSMIAAPLAQANYACAGAITGLVVSPSGLVTVSSPDAGLNSVYVCQIGATYNGVATDTCKGILAVLLAAKATGQIVQWSFNDSLSCGTRPSWTNLTGWYYGPELL